jgi:elongation factor Ts
VFAVVSDTGHLGSVVSVACETDFVARTPDFEGFLTDLCAHVASENPADASVALGQSWQGGDETVEDAVKRTISKLGENIQVSEVCRMENAGGLIATYVHHNQKVGVMVSVTTDVERANAEGALRTLCMHIAATRPAVLDRADMDAATVEREKDIYRAEIEGKPAEIQERILEGKMSRFYGESVLREQAWVMDDSKTVQQALDGELGGACTIEAFVRFEIGS